MGASYSHDVRTCNITLSASERKGAAARPACPSDKQYQDIGKRLEAIRCGLTNDTEKQFAARFGKNDTQYYNWKSGLRRIPVDAAEQLCATYGVTLDWIYMGRRDGLSERASKVL